MERTSKPLRKFQMRAIIITNKLTEIVCGIKKREEAISDVARDVWDESNCQSNSYNLSNDENFAA